MTEWFNNFSFSDVVLALTLLVSSIAAYFNLDSKLNSITDKVNDVELAQEKMSVELKAIEVDHKKELLQTKASSETRFTLIEERQRATDVFIGRFDEKMTYLVEQVRQLATFMERRN